MARARRRTTAAVVARLFDEPRRFDFFQAVRVLERQAAHAARDPRFRVRRPVGHDYTPADEAVRFHVEPQLSYPGNALLTAEAEKNGAPPALGVTFIGLVGPSGVLPQHYSELVVAQNRKRSTALAQFLDLIHHRSISLFYRAWLKYRPALTYERSGGDEADTFTGLLASLTGFGSPGLRNRLAFSDHLIWHFSGLLSTSRRGKTDLEALLSEVLRRPVRVESFVGGWLDIAEDSQTRLPSFNRPEGQFCRLGVDTVAGARAWDAQGRFRLKIGPLDYRRFLDFMPGGDETARLSDLVRLYVGPEFDADVEVALSAGEAPPLHLSGPCPEAPRLGWNTWLLAEPCPVERRDAVFRLSGLDDEFMNKINEEGSA